MYILWKLDIRRKIKDYQKQYDQCVQQLQNDERGRKLASIQRQINETTDKLNEYRNQREPLQHKSEPTIEMKDNENKLNQRRADKTRKQQEKNGFRVQITHINQQNNRYELFADPQLKARRITVKQIRTELQRYSSKFHRVPIGPLGEYIKMVPNRDQNILNRHIQIVQAVLKQTLYSFLVDTAADLELFKKIMRKRFKFVPPAMQWKYTNTAFQIEANVFDGYRTRDADGPIIRVTDMFTVRDNNPWIYNAIITNSSPERVYAHGTLNAAKALLQSLDQHKLKRIANIMTYKEERGLYTVTRKKGTVGGNPVRPSHPILQSDTSQLKAWLSQELNRANRELVDIDRSINELHRFVQQSNRETEGYKQQLRQLTGKIRTAELRLESLQRKQRDLQEDEEDNDEIQQTMTELQNSIEDEKSGIQGLLEEIEPFKKKEEELLNEHRECKKKLHELENKVKEQAHSSGMLKDQYRKMCAELTKLKRSIDAIPPRIEQYERELEDEKKELEQEIKRVKALSAEAIKAGPEITRENYPRNAKNRNRVYRLSELIQERRRIQADLEEWRKAAPPADEIKQRFDAIKPKYETHQERVDRCNQHVDEMNRLLVHRTREWQQMKDHVRRRLSIEFRIIMRKQGHEGGLDIDYGEKKLDMRVHMASHDGLTQVVNSKTLSGGERSFTQVALIMALQKFSGSPMCIYDEFDVFMDSINRGNSIKILLGAALGDKEKKSPPERQYIFITPNDISPVIASGHQKNYISIHKLNPPRK